MSASHARRRRWAQRHDDLARLLALALIERGVKRRQKLNRQVELNFALASISNLPVRMIDSSQSPPGACAASDP
jgi:predicted phage-related endonuclease